MFPPGDSIPREHFSNYRPYYTKDYHRKQCCEKRKPWITLEMVRPSLNAGITATIFGSSE